MAKLSYNIADSPPNSSFSVTARREGGAVQVCAMVGRVNQSILQIQYTGNNETGMVVVELEMVSGDGRL